MTKLNTVAAAVAVSLGLAATAFAHPGQMGGGMGPGAQAGQHQGMQGMKHGKGRAARGESDDGANRPTPRGPQAGHSLMTPDERAALHERMQKAATPEERREIAMATRAEMQKRAAEQGVALPEHRGPHGHGNAPATGHSH